MAGKNGFKNGDLEHRRQEVQQLINNACDQLNGDGVDPRDYVEQLAWLFFLKAFDETETRRENEAAFDNEGGYKRRLDGKYSWSNWSGMINKPDEMLEFVDRKLWIKLTSAESDKGMGEDAVGIRFRRIFSTVRNHCRRGATFARVVQQINRLHFSDATDVIALTLS
jgi:type I restriction enzyme M protein